MRRSILQRARSEEGIALLVTLSFLLAIAAMGISALTRAQEEQQVSAASRRHVKHLMAADAGIQIALTQLQNSVGFQTNTQPIDVVNIASDGNGLGTRIRSGVPGNPTAQPIQFVRYVAAGGSGSQLNLGSGNGGGGQRAIYRVNIVADDPGGAMVQVQAQLGIDAPSVGY